MVEPTFAEKLAAAKKKREAVAAEAVKPKGMNEAEQQRLLLVQNTLVDEIAKGGRAGTWVDMMVVRPTDFLGGVIVQGDIASHLAMLAPDTGLRAFVQECNAVDIRCYVYLQGHMIGNDGYWLKVMLP